MEPYTTAKKFGKMGGTKDNHDLPQRLRKEFADLKRKSRRKRRRTDKRKLGITEEDL
jgi:hypothetical protein